MRVVPIEDASLSVLGPLVDLQENPDPALVGHLFEVLGALISMSARTAVQRASTDELERMQSIVQTLADNVQDPEQQHQGWRDLATLFAQVNNNLVLRLILNGLKTQLINRLEARPKVELNIDYDQELETLKKLAQGLTTRDSRCVASTINEHFDSINDRIQNALSPTPMTNSAEGLTHE